MGLIQAAVVATASTLGDTWKEFFYCDAIPADVLVVKGKKKTGLFSSNRGNDNIITNGSTIAVSDGQCMIIVDQGQVVEICAVPG
ncbi:MAG: SPFH domain-containing protein, partial [Ruminococcus sp.]|nr:SPFH domain-containing protein [Ruminococcus sp.]